MNLVYRLKKLYMSTPNASINYIISEFFLLNMQNIDDITINDISKKIGISKSAISKFCLESGCTSFSQFKNTLYLDYIDVRNDLIIMQQDYLTSIRDLNILLRCKEFFDSHDFNTLFLAIKKTKKIILTGDMHYISLLEKLTTWLLFNGIKINEIYLWNQNAMNEKIEKLNENDLIILVSPNTHLNQYLDLMPFYNDEIKMIKNSKARCYFLGQSSSRDNKNFFSIAIPTYISKVHYEMFFLLFANEIICRWNKK